MGGDDGDGNVKMVEVKKWVGCMDGMCRLESGNAHEWMVIDWSLFSLAYVECNQWESA